MSQEDLFLQNNLAERGLQKNNFLKAEWTLGTWFSVNALNAFRFLGKYLFSIINK